MGAGGYSIKDRNLRATNLGYFDKGIDDIFDKKELHIEMNPKDVMIRESRDSEEHPNSLAIIIALDVTGSMGMIPYYLVKEGLPHIMGEIFKAGIKDPQILLMGVGDHKCDQAPFQVGQYESNDELLDKWLTSIYLEGHGGGNGGESYHLAWYFAGHRTSIDCFEKRNQKGFLFTIGDDAVHKDLPKNSFDQIFNKGEFENMSSFDCLQQAQKMYNVFHIHINETMTGQQSYVLESWKEILGNNLIEIKDHKNVSKVISTKIIETLQLNSVETKMDIGQNSNETNFIV